MAYLCPSDGDFFAWLRLTKEERYAQLTRLCVPETTVREWEKLHGLCATADRGGRGDYRGPHAYEVVEACRKLLIADDGCMRALASSIATRNRQGESRLCNCGRALFIDCAGEGCSSAQYVAAEILANKLLERKV